MLRGNQNRTIRWALVRAIFLLIGHAAEAADLAARAALANARATVVSATVCRAFMDEMDRHLRRWP